MKLILGWTLLIAAQAQTVWFEPNQGQVAGPTQWVCRSKGAYIYLKSDEMVYATGENVHARLVGASRRAVVEGLEQTGGYSSYFTGRNHSTWFTGIPQYAKLRYRDVYPGIDIVYYGSGRNLEYDFLVKPGADPASIKLAFSKPARIDGTDLVVAGIRQHRPRVFQNGSEISAEYRIASDGAVQFALAEYDRSRELTVDPVMEFSTYLGGPGEEGVSDVKVDDAGNIYLTGYAQSPATPSLDPFQQPSVVAENPFVLKLDSSGRRVLYYAVLGSNSWDSASRLALDSTGGVVVVGSARSANFPLKNAFLSEFRAAYRSGFITRLSPDGKSLVYSTYYGGSGAADDIGGLAVDAQGNTYISGGTNASDIPIKNALQPHIGGSYNAFLAKIAPSGTLVFSTYFGADNAGFGPLALAPDGSIIVAGSASDPKFPFKNPVQTDLTQQFGSSTPTIVKIAGDGQSLLYATYIGGRIAGNATALTVDAMENIYLSGWMIGAGLNVKNAFQSAPLGRTSSFLIKLDAKLNLIYSTYLGGSGSTADYGCLAVDINGSAYVCGYTDSSDFPLKDSLQNFKGGGVLQDDCFVSKFAPTGESLLYSTFIGGSRNEGCSKITVDEKGGAYFVGSTWSEDFPVKNAFQPRFGGGNGDGFLVKISDTTAIAPSPLTPSTSHIVFQFVVGGLAPTSQKIAIQGGLFTASSTAGWLTAAASPDNSVSVSVNPAGLSPGTYRAAVFFTPPVGAPATVDVVLTVLAVAPTLTAVQPNLVPTGSNDTVITIRGSAFTSNSEVWVNGLVWTDTPVTFVDSSTLKLTLPFGYFTVEFNHTIAVRNPGSAQSNVLSVAVGKPAPYFTSASVTNAASFISGPVSPGEIITIFGTNLDGTVTFDDRPATVVATSPTQLSVTVPYAIEAPSTLLRVGLSIPVKLDVSPASPGIFAAVADQGVLTLYATGCGALTKADLPRCILPVLVLLNGETAEVPYAGSAPDLIEGVNQVNVRIPDGISGKVGIVLKAGVAVSKEFQAELP